MSYTLPITKNWGQILVGQDPNLVRALDQFYTEVTLAINAATKKMILDGANPPANADINKLYTVGDLAIRTDNNTAWIMTSRSTNTAVTWTQIT